MKKTVNQELKKERNDRIKQFLKDMIAPTIFVLIVGFVLYKMATYVKPDDGSDIPPMYEYNGATGELTLDKNSSLIFTMDPATTQFKVKDTKTGKEWSSNPDISLETMALSDEKAKIQSLLTLQYSDRTGKVVTFDSFSKSIEKKRFYAEKVSDANGEKIVVHFSISEKEEDIIIPPVATKDEFEAYIEKIRTEVSDYEADDTLDYYDFLDKDKLPADKKDELLERYEILKEESLYTLFPNQNKKMLALVEERFKKIGYTEEQYKKDLELDSEAVVEDTPVFNLDVEFRVKDNKLMVSIPFNSIANMQKFPITKVNLLPFFGAGSKQDEGFLFVPEGGGAIINFNNMKNTLQAYASRVYGWDLCLVRKSVVHDPLSNFGVFGISNKTNGNSFICIPGDGASYCAIQADISGRTNSFNYVYAQYDIYQREQYDVSGQVANFDIYKYIDKLPEDEVIEQTYIFVDSPEYVDMAKAYEGYLKDTYGESYFKLSNDTDTPINVELIGAVDKTEQILGIPVSRPLELTSFEEAGEILDDLNAAGIKNVSIKYTGWCNGGVNQTVLGKAKPVSKLGGKSGLRSFAEKANGYGYNVALNGITMLALDSNIFDGFFSFTDAAKNISEERMELHKYSAVTFALREGSESYYLLHTDLILKYADNLVAAADDYNVGASFDDIGKDIPSDFWSSGYHSRENVRKLHTELLKKYADEGKYIVVNAGNEYAIPYVDMITNMDLSGSNYTILDENIPFLELVIHGMVKYTGESLNICGDYEEELLYSAAYGAGLSFTLMNESAFTLQDTLYTHYYGCDYSGWKDRMLEIYNRYNKELGHVFSKRMIGFKYIAPGVSCTEYEGGTKVYVNFNHADYKADDGNVYKARDYKVVK